MKRYLILLFAALIMIPSMAQALTVTIGYTSIGGLTYTIAWDGVIAGTRVTLPDASIDSITAYLEPSAPGIVATSAIYTNAGALVGQTSEVPLNAGTGWYVFPNATGITVAAGNYWLVTWANDDTNFYYDATAGYTSLDISASYTGAFPDPLGAFTTQANRRYSIYASYSNSATVFTNMTPANGTTRYTTSFNWACDINDPDGDTFSWSVNCSNGQHDEDTGYSNGTVGCALSGLAYFSSYTIWVNATDVGSLTTTRCWYTFTVFPSNLMLTQDTFPTNWGPYIETVYSRGNMPAQVNITLSNASSLYHYTIYGTVGANISGLPSQSLVGEYFQRDVTGNGTYSFPLDSDQYPFSLCRYNVSFHARAYSGAHVYIGPNISSAVVCFSLDGGADPFYENHVMFRDHQPPTMSLHATDMVSDGVMVNTSVIGAMGGGPPWYGDFSLQTMTIYVFATDNAYPQNILGYLSWNINYRTADEATLWKTYYYDCNDYWEQIANSVFMVNGSYFLFYGVLLTGGVTAANTFIDLPDSTLSRATFSTTALTGSGTLVQDTSSTYDFTGAMVYFECPADTGMDVSFTVGNLGLIIRNYGDAIGLPWLYLLAALVVVLVCVFFPFGLALKYGFELPNFLYAVFIFAGVIIDYGINLLDLWMLALIILAVVLAVTVKFQDAIKEFTVQKETGILGKVFSLNKRNKASAQRLKNAKAGAAAYKATKDEGVKKAKKVKRWVPDRSMPGGFREE